MSIAHLVPGVRPGPIKFLLFPHITLAPHLGALWVLRVMKLLAQGDTDNCLDLRFLMVLPQTLLLNTQEEAIAEQGTAST